jgi:hypothetical protein
MPVSNPNQPSPLTTTTRSTSSLRNRHNRRNRRLAITGCVVAAVVPVTFPTVVGALSVGSVASEAAAPAASGSAHSVLTARAVLPAKTFRAGSTASGTFFSGTDRTNAGLNGIAVPVTGAAFEKQPLQGISAVIPAGNGEWWAMSDNGFGARNNSGDFELWVNRIAIDPATGTVTAKGGFGLSDPDKKIPWKIACDPENGAALPSFDFNVLPAKPAFCAGGNRKLTGFDFDLESMQVGRDGSFWFGEEFGPFLLHTSPDGKLLETPIGSAALRSPQNPLLMIDAGEKPTIGQSRGFEGMGISVDRSRLYPLFEGPNSIDNSNTLRILEFDIRKRAYTNRVMTIALEGNGGRVNLTTLKRADGAAAYPGAVAPSDNGGQAIGELTIINDRQALLIERDSGGDSPAAPRMKKVFLLDLPRGSGPVTKTLLLDLMGVPDPANIGKDGAFFRFPFLTIESIHVVDPSTLVIANDNNFPFSNGRSFSKGGPLAADDNEFIFVKLGTPLKVDRRVLRSASTASEAAEIGSFAPAEIEVETEATEAS